MKELDQEVTTIEVREYRVSKGRAHVTIKRTWSGWYIPDTPPLAVSMLNEWSDLEAATAAAHALVALMHEDQLRQDRLAGELQDWSVAHAENQP